MKPFIREHHGVTPTIGEGSFVAETAALIGDVVIGKQSSIWYHCVLRGDGNYIRVGDRTNIQDGTIVHINSGDYPCIIGSDVSIGHAAIVHACTLEDWAFVGMGATVLDGAVVESYGIVAANALVAPGKVVKSRELWVGNPARKLRDLTDRDFAMIEAVNKSYIESAATY